jgi:hypothetical protein
MTGMLQMRRTRGALSGILLILLGLWGALIPFIGPYFHYAYTPDSAWTYNTGRLWLEILPGAAAFLGGVLLVIAAGRHIALFGALLAAAAGAWFALGTVVSPLWNTAAQAGTPVGATVLTRAVEQIGFFTGLGIVIVFVAAAAAGRVLAVPSGLAPAPTAAPETETIPVTEAATVPVATSGAAADREAPLPRRLPHLPRRLSQRRVTEEQAPAKDSERISADFHAR